jgi:hypothetical protein
MLARLRGPNRAAPRADSAYSRRLICRLALEHEGHFFRREVAERAHRTFGVAGKCRRYEWLQDGAHPTLASSEPLPPQTLQFLVASEETVQLREAREKLRSRSGSHALPGSVESGLSVDGEEGADPDDVLGSHTL